MKTRILIIIGVVMFVVGATYADLEAYGMGVASGIQAGVYRIEGETFPKTTVSVGESFFVNGTLVSLVEKDIQGKMNVMFDYANNDPWFVNLLKSNFSCLVQDMCTKPILVLPHQNHWYLDIKPNPDAYALDGNMIIPYSIEMTALKGGTYHIHTDPSIDIKGYARIGPGQTIIVEGSQDITEGELFEFYIPYTGGFVLIMIGLGYGVVFVYRRIRK